MAFGDVGGTIRDLVFTCEADCDISKGDAVALVGNYRVSIYKGNRIFGQAMKDVNKGDALPVKKRGVCVFTYADSDYPPRVNGVEGCCMSSTVPGEVALFHDATNINLKVDEARGEVHVLL